MATEIKSWGAQVTYRATDTAGLMLIPYLGWSVFGFVAIGALLPRVGMQTNDSHHQLWFLGIIGVEWALTYWFHYALLKSSRWHLYRTEFAGYSPGKRLLGSILAFLLLVFLAAIPFYLIHHLSSLNPSSIVRVK
ncbi:hypothetical protein JAO73_11930 [Hymenobacter sp. BT523]|uniref:hypothetical protein n=1 Tax=Hymenobacter sp. BT523 TaxID=2795725 RepID=UPI0018EB6787|nr:hypothetical protein [Hymenobacter sp. BT523]MBJ6109726.1 hypothetical protein [Hymenobacter sp. BT523]